jgi:hypothetical protein
MLKINGHEIWRGGEKVGFIDGNYIRAHDWKKLGYFEGNHIYNMMGKKIAYIEGDHLYEADGSNIKISLDKVNESITEGLITEICKCAIYILIGA